MPEEYLDVGKEEDFMTTTRQYKLDLFEHYSKEKEYDGGGSWKRNSTLLEIGCRYGST